MKNILLILIISILFFSCKKDSYVKPLFYSITAVSTLKQDQTTLNNLMSEIQDLATSKPCTNSNDWKWIEYGDKPCGGPWGYIAYHKDINTADFFHKIDFYFKLEEKYNSKHGAVSTCDLAPYPNSISCVNGEAVLIY